MLRDDGMPNAIDPIIEGTSAEGMSTTDFLYWFGDFASGEVQYSHTSRFCNSIRPFLPFSNEKRFKALCDIQIKGGNSPEGYDVRDNYPLLSTTINVNDSGRQWTYQYCTEFGFFQTASKLNRIRATSIDDDYFLRQCQFIFPDLDMATLPAIKRTLDEYGGNKIQASNIFFTNGS